MYSSNQEPRCDYKFINVMRKTRINSKVIKTFRAAQRIHMRIEKGQRLTITKTTANVLIELVETCVTRSNIMTNSIKETKPHYIRVKTIFSVKTNSM